MYKVIIILFFILNNCCNCAAQLTLPYNFKFKNYTTLNGMADNVVVKTVKDKHGFLWIATHNGISRFDGLKFKNYSHNPADSTSLRSIWISDLLIDEQQTLWASTEWGVCYYDAINDNFRYINKKSELQVLYEAPMCMGKDGFIWVALEDGLKKINPITKKYTNTSLSRISDPKFIVYDNKGVFYIGTRASGIIKYNSITDNYYSLRLSKLPSTTQYLDAFMDEGRLWVATDVGLLLLNENETYALFSKGIDAADGKNVTLLVCVNSFASAFGNQQLVVGTYDKKMFLFDKVKKAFVYEWQSSVSNPDGFPASVVYNLYADNKILWIGTDRGLSQINLENQQVKSYQIKEVLGLVKKVIAVNNKNIVCAIPWHPYNGILLYDMIQQKIIKQYNIEAGNSQRYYDIIKTKRGGIIAVRDFAIDFFSETLQKVKTISLKNKPFCIYENEDGNLWVGMDNGIAYVDIVTNKTNAYYPNFIGTDVEKNSIAGEFPIVGITKSSNNTLWIACLKYGLFSFDIGTKKFEVHRQSFNTSYSTLNRCSSVEIIGNDSIWVGNMDGLACYIPSQKKFLNYNISNGLKSSYVYSLAKDSANNLYCRGNADLFYFNTHNYKIISATLNPGIDAFNYMQRLSIAENNILLGHEAGFTIFNATDFIKPITTKSLLKIISYKGKDGAVFLESDSNISTIKFKYYDNQIGFDFVAIEYNYPEEIEYWYKLEGMEKDFINGADNRTVSYNNLPHGKYRFEVYALNKHSNIKSNIAFFAFTIKPAIWQRWWFWPLLGLLFVLGVVHVARKRVAAIRQKEKQKTAVNKAMAELETKMFRSQMNPHFIFNSLNSIQKYIWENKEEDAAEYLARFAKLIRAILENSRKETIPLYEEIEVMKLYVELEHRRSNAHFDYSIKVSEDVDVQNISIPPLLMQPFIENAIWHGLNKKQEKGNLLLSITKKEGQLICIIDDDGVGRQENVASVSIEKKSLGITITQQRIDRLMETTKLFASVSIEDKKENGMAMGTTVTLTLPLQTITNA